MLLTNLQQTRLALITGLMLSSLPTFADDPFTDALKSGKASMNERLRFENVADEAFAENANALTLRSRIGYETAPLYGFTWLTEFEDIRVVGGNDDYQFAAPPTPSPAGAAVVADPEMTELNRLQLRYRGVPKLDMILGRQRLFYDNHRWIGNVGWRQDEQTYDAFSAVYTGLPDFSFSYAYVDAVNGFASTSDKTTGIFDADTSDHLINISYNGFTWGKFILYSYNLHNQNDTLKGPAAAINVNAGLRYINNDTNGLRFDGAYVLPTTVSLRALYRAEFAKQSADVMEGTPVKRVDYDANYGLVEAGMAWGFGGGSFALTPMLGYEVLGSDKGKYGLQTPYATKHAFNGWVDQFLVTPKEGLQDIYATIGFDWNTYAIKTLLMYHDYKSDEDNTGTKKEVDFGSETSLQIVKPFGAHWIVGTKGSVYETETHELAATKKPDAKKFWVWAEYNF